MVPSNDFPFDKEVGAAISKEDVGFQMVKIS